MVRNRTLEDELARANHDAREAARRATILITDEDPKDEGAADAAETLREILNVKNNLWRDLLDRVAAVEGLLWPVGTPEAPQDESVTASNLKTLIDEHPTIVDEILSALRTKVIAHDFCTDLEKLTRKALEQLQGVVDDRDQEINRLKIRIADMTLDRDVPRPTTEEAPHRSKAFSHPDKLDDGKIYSFDAWEIEMRGKLTNQARDYPTDTDQVLYIYSRTTGTARDHMTPRMKATSLFRLKTAEEAFALLDMVFNDPMQKQKKKREYRSWRYIPEAKPYQEFYTQFMTLAQEAEIDEEDLKNDLYEKLPDEMQLQVARDAFCETVDFIHFARTVQNQAYATESIQKKKGRGNRTGTGTKSGQSATTRDKSSKSTTARPKSPTPSGKQQNSDGKWTFDDPKKQDRYQKGACFSCGEEGHLASACPNKEQAREKTPAVKTSDPSKKKRKVVIVETDSDQSPSEDESGKD
jgi:hypothetical protein